MTNLNLFRQRLRRSWRGNRKHGGTGCRCLQADTSDRAASVILQERMRRLFDVELAAFNAESSPLRNAFDYAKPVHALGLQSIARGQ